MRFVTYKLYTADQTSDDPERAILPTLMYAARRNDIAYSQVLAIGWWAWGIGIIRTVVDDTKLK
jgi:hypothetical protein